MALRYLMSTSISLLFALLLCLCFSDAAPAFKFKKSFSAYTQERYPPRAERRLVGGASPIHFITPYMGMPQSMNNFNFFAHQASMGNPASSSIYKLPLRLFSNGKPHAVFHGIPKTQNVLEYLPQAVSNIIRLPLKYMSNAKPVGVYFKNPTFNYL